MGIQVALHQSDKSTIASTLRERLSLMYIVAAKLDPIYAQGYCEGGKKMAEEIGRIVGLNVEQIDREARYLAERGMAGRQAGK